MKVLYPAKISYSKEDKSYLVEFPNLEGCLTEGATLRPLADTCVLSR